MLVFLTGKERETLASLGTTLKQNRTLLEEAKKDESIKMLSKEDREGLEDMAKFGEGIMDALTHISFNREFLNAIVLVYDKLLDADRIKYNRRMRRKDPQGYENYLSVLEVLASLKKTVKTYSKEQYKKDYKTIKDTMEKMNEIKDKEKIRELFNSCNDRVRTAIALLGKIALVDDNSEEVVKELKDKYTQEEKKIKKEMRQHAKEEKRRNSK